MGTAIGFSTGVSLEEASLERALAAREQGFLGELALAAQTAERFGLVLSGADMAQLALRRTAALAETGRVELGESAVPKLVTAFCDAPYLLKEEFAATIGRLTEAFYEYKNEDRGRMTDDELIACLRVCCDAYEGALDAALTLSLDDLRRKRRLDEPDDLPDDEEEGEDV